MKKSEKRIILFALFGSIILTIILLLAANNRRLYDKSKPNIFEIPGTAYEYTLQNKTYFGYYFMVQKKPTDTAEIHNMIDNFINENHNIISNAFDESASYVEFHFMIPSTHFPVYFEQDKNPFIMNDFIIYYEETNEFLSVTFESANDSGYYDFRYYDFRY